MSAGEALITHALGTAGAPSHTSAIAAMRERTRREQERRELTREGTVTRKKTEGSKRRLSVTSMLKRRGSSAAEAQASHRHLAKEAPGRSSSADEAKASGIVAERPGRQREMKKEAAQRQANECMQQMTARTQQMTARAGQQEAEAGGGSAGAAGVKLAAKSPPTPPAIKSKTSPQKKRISFVDEGDEAAAAALEA